MASPGCCPRLWQHYPDLAVLDCSTVIKPNRLLPPASCTSENTVPCWFRNELHKHFFHYFNFFLWQLWIQDVLSRRQNACPNKQKFEKHFDAQPCWSWWLICSLDNVVFCANKLLQQLTRPTFSFTYSVVMDMWLWNKSVMSSLSFQYVWFNVANSSGIFPLAFIINTPLFLYQHVLSSESVPNPK